MTKSSGFPDLVLLELSKNPLFVSLLTNIPDASLDDKDTAAKWNICTNNYIAVDETITDTMSFCCVDTRIKMDGTEVVNAYIDILVGVHRDVMSLRGTAFTGLSGNRRDNLIREIDYTLRGSHAFGIGGLEPDRIYRTGKDSQLSAVRVQSNPLQGRDLRTIEEYKPWKNKRVLTAFSRASR